MAQRLSFEERARIEAMTAAGVSVEEVERVTWARVSLIATGFMANRGIIDRRLW